MDKWAKAAGIRAIRTVAQTACSMFTVGMLISEVNWKAVISTSILAGVYSILTSLAGLPEVEEDE